MDTSNTQQNTTPDISVDEKIKAALAFGVPKYGDTPTDANQLTPKKYVDLNSGKTIISVLSDSSTVVTNATLGNLFTLTTSQNFTMSNPTGGLNGQKIIYKIKQDATGSRIVTWDSKFRGSNDLPLPVLTTTAGYVDYVGFIYDSVVDFWNCLSVNEGFAT